MWGGGLFAKIYFWKGAYLRTELSNNMVDVSWHTVILANKAYLRAEFTLFAEFKYHMGSHYRGPYLSKFATRWGLFQGGV